MLHNPRTRMVYDDARHYLLTTTEKFDIIASDPLDVFVKGTAALYSEEYFEAVKRHLKPACARSWTGWWICRVSRRNRSRPRPHPNPKTQAPNPKQIPMTEAQMTKPQRVTDDRW